MSVANVMFSAAVFLQQLSFETVYKQSFFLGK